MENTEILLVKNELTGKSVNVKPLFRLMFDLSENSNDIKEFRKSIEDVARFITLHTDRNIIQDCTDLFQHHCFVLYQLADALDKMENF